MRSTPDPAVALDNLRSYFDASGELAAQGRIRFAVQHPFLTLGAIRDARSLPRLQRPRASGPDADLIERAMDRRSGPLTRDFWSLTALLPVDPESRRLARPRRSMARAIRLAHRGGLRWHVVPPGNEQRSLLDRARAVEQERHPEHQPDPAVNEALLGRGLWIVAKTQDDRPLLQVVVLLDGEWALLANFRSVESSADAGNARFWMTAVLADELSARGVRYLIEATHPVRLSNGLRYFQRITGYTIARIESAPRPLLDREASDLPDGSFSTSLRRPGRRSSSP